MQVRRAAVACALPLLVQIVEMLDKDENDALGKYAQAAEKRVVKGIVEALETVLDYQGPVYSKFEALKRVDALAPLLTENYVNRKLFDALLLGFGDKNDDARLLTLMGMLAIAPVYRRRTGQIGCCEWSRG